MYKRQEQEADYLAEIVGKVHYFPMGKEEPQLSDSVEVVHEMCIRDRYIMKKINLRELYPNVYTTDFFVDVTEEVMENIRAAERLSLIHIFSAFLAPAFPITYIRGKFRG